MSCLEARRRKSPTERFTHVTLTGIPSSHHILHAYQSPVVPCLGLNPCYAYARWQLAYHTSTWCNTSSHLVHESPFVPRAAVRVRHLYCSMNAIAGKLTQQFSNLVGMWDLAFEFHLRESTARKASSVIGHLTELTNKQIKELRKGGKAVVSRFRTCKADAAVDCLSPVAISCHPWRWRRLNFL